MKYEIIDTIVATNETRTESVRVSATVGEGSQPALQYTGRNIRVVLFEPNNDGAEAVNRFVSEMFGDECMFETLNTFTGRYA